MRYINPLYRTLPYDMGRGGVCPAGVDLLLPSVFLSSVLDDPGDIWAILFKMDRWYHAGSTPRNPDLCLHMQMSFDVCPAAC